MHVSDTKAAVSENAEPGRITRSTLLKTHEFRGIFAWIIVGTVALGVVGRVKHYLARPSYWNDEAAVVANVMHRDWRHLLDRLDYAQAAPPLFLWSERAMYRLLGPGEYSLRLLPMLCGLAVLPLYSLLAWRTVSPVSACWAVAWFTFFQKLAHRANDVKQYSGDVLIAVLLLLTVFGRKEEVSASRRMLSLSLLAAVGLWFSFPVPFLFGALSLVLLPDCLRRGRPAQLTWMAGNVLVVISFLALAKTALSQGGDPSLLEFWRNSFPDFHHVLKIPLWFAGEVYGLFGYPFDSFGAITTLLAVLGCIALIQPGRAPKPFSSRLPTVLLLALLLAFVAAALHRYPFPGRHRLGLYLIPISILILGAGADSKTLGVPVKFRKAWWLLTVPLILLESVNFIKDLVLAREDSTTRPVVEFVRSRRQINEPIYLYGDSLSAGPASGRSAEFLCYWPDVPGRVVVGFFPPEEIHEDKFWAVYSLNRSETKSPRFAEQLLKLMGPQAQVIEACQPGEQSGAMLIQRHPIAKGPQ